MLFTAGIMTHRVVKRSAPGPNGDVIQKPDILAHLQRKDNGTLAISDNAVWAPPPAL